MPVDLVYLQGLPRPENLAQLLGYPRDHKRVAFYWEADDLVWKDSLASSNTADWYAWRLFTEHPVIAPFFAPFDWYEEGEIAPNFLLLDQEKNRAAVGPMSVIDRALGPPPPLEAPRQGIDQNELEGLLQRMRQFSPQVARTIESRRAERLAQLKRWLKHLLV